MDNGQTMTSNIDEMQGGEDWAFVRGNFIIKGPNDSENKGV